MSARVLRGGSGAARVVRHPDRVGAYHTVRHGWADEIAPDEGELAILLEAGDEYRFSVWIVGTPDELQAWTAKAKYPEDVAKIRAAFCGGA